MLFLDEVYFYTQKIKKYPVTIDRLIYDKRFTPGWLIEHLENSEDDDGMWMDGGHCFEYMFEEVELSRFNLDYVCYICNSIDIKEDYPGGDYAYYTGSVIHGIPFIHHQSSHRLEYPDMLSIYGPDISLIVRADSIFVEIFETVPRVRDMFFIKNQTEKIGAIRHFLENTDRTVFNDKQFHSLRKQKQRRE